MDRAAVTSASTAGADKPQIEVVVGDGNGSVDQTIQLRKRMSSTLGASVTHEKVKKKPEVQATMAWHFHYQSHCANSQSLTMGYLNSSDMCLSNVRIVWFAAKGGGESLYAR